MPSNIEIKAVVRDLGRIRGIAARIASGPGQTLRQEDVFFRAAKGRLKLRIFSERSGELIQYQRPDGREAKRSDYQIYRTAQPLELRRLLATALGETITVTKTRDVYIAGQTRIHLDEVDDLGTFVELEVVLSPDQTEEEGRRVASDLMERLGIQDSDLVCCAYADLLNEGDERGQV